MLRRVRRVRIPLFVVKLAVLAGLVFTLNSITHSLATLAALSLTADLSLYALFRARQAA